MASPVPSLRADLHDPASLAAMGHIEIVARFIVDGFMAGLHRSPRKGFSVEFADYRAYQSGDDPRFVDWKIAARMDRWVVRQYVEETNLRATMVLDVSKSMHWSGASLRSIGVEDSGTSLTKASYAEIVAASIALLLLRQRDAVGLIRYDAALRSVVPPRSRIGHWRRIVAALEESGSAPESSAPEALRQAARLINRRGMIVLISDLLMDAEELEHSLRALRALGHDVTVLHIMDPVERWLGGSGEARFQDTESPLSVTTSVADVRTAYRATVDEVIKEWSERLASFGISYELILTDAPFGVPLRRAFAARQRLP